jgi:hypothetical protein
VAKHDDLEELASWAEFAAMVIRQPMCLPATKRKIIIDAIRYARDIRAQGIDSPTIMRERAMWSVWMLEHKRNATVIYVEAQFDPEGVGRVPIESWNAALKKWKGRERPRGKGKGPHVTGTYDWRDVVDVLMRHFAPGVTPESRRKLLTRWIEPKKATKKPRR